MTSLDDRIDKLLAELQTPKPLQAVVHNILDEPIPETDKRRLLMPILPSRARPFPPPQPNCKSKEMKPILEEFDQVPHLKINSSRLSKRSLAAAAATTRRAHLQTGSLGNRGVPKRMGI